MEKKIILVSGLTFFTNYFAEILLNKVYENGVAMFLNNYDNDVKKLIDTIKMSELKVFIIPDWSERTNVYHYLSENFSEVLRIRIDDPVPYYNYNAIIYTSNCTPKEFESRVLEEFENEIKEECLR